MHNVTPLPQADGADRPFDTHGATGPVRVHVEKSGPAFTSEAEFVMQVVNGVQTQTLVTAGEVLNAIDRHCALDLFAAWTRLLVMADLRLPIGYQASRPNWFWTEAHEAVVAALCYAEQGPYKWITADSLLRQKARECAIQAQEHLQHTGYADAATLRANLAAYEAFAEGRQS